MQAMGQAFLYSPKTLGEKNTRDFRKSKEFGGSWEVSRGWGRTHVPTKTRGNLQGECDNSSLP